MTRRRLTTLSAGLAMVALMVAAAVAFASPAHAALGLRENADAGPWTTNGKVYAQALSEDGRTLYIGGRFSTLRERPTGAGGETLAVNNVAAIDVETGAPVRAFRPAVTSNDGTRPAVRALAAENGRIYVGGSFTTVGGQARRNLAAVDAASGAVGSFSASVGTNTSTVYALAADVARLYVGGTFASVNGTSRGNLAAVNPSTGAVHVAWRARANNVVRALAFGPGGDGTIFAVGGFKNVTGSDGVRADRQSVARLDAATGNVHPWAIPAGQVQTDSGRNNNMTCRAETVTAARIFVDCGLGPNYSAAYRLDNGDSGDRVWQTGFGGNPQASAMSPDGTRLIVGGHFGINPIKQQVCGKPLGGLIALNPENGQVDCSSNWVPHLDQNVDPSYDGAWSVVSTPQHVWVGGGFVGVSGQPRTNLARFTYDPTLKTVNAAPAVDLDGLQRGGLDATYFDDQNFSGTQVRRTDPTVDFDWGNGSPDPAIGADTFSARWSGQVEAPVSGEYTFTTTTDDGVRLFVDGRQVIDNWTDRAPTDDSATVTLETGRRYDVQMDYYENGGGAVARLQWAYPGQARQAVPANRLFFSGDTGYSATFTAGSGPSPVADPNNLAVTDPDDAGLRSATVRLLDDPDGSSESLSADTAGTNIAANYDSQAGSLILTGTETKAAYQQVLRTASYDNACVNPAGGQRRVSFVVSDGSADSATATATVEVRGADGQPSAGECEAANGDDVTAPAVTRPRPAPGAEIRDRTPTVRATVRDASSDLAASDVRLYVDGDRKAFSYDPDTDRLSRAAGRLSYGRHSVRVEAEDAAGNAASRAWSFRVVRGR